MDRSWYSATAMMDAMSLRKSETPHSDYFSATENEAEYSPMSPESKAEESDEYEYDCDSDDMDVDPSAPLSPDNLMLVFPFLLTEFEKDEIQAYKEIYYGGIPAAWKDYTGEENYGFDSKSGASSTVHKAFDHKENKHVALKIVKNTEVDNTNADREMFMLHYLNERDVDGRNNVIKLLDSGIFRGHRFLVFDVFSQSLLDYMRTRPHNRLHVDEIRIIARKVMQCLAYLENRNIVHVDIKPENIMIPDGRLDELVVIDFGSCSFVDKRDRKVDYVQSRYYRAPEVILGLDFGRPVDMWSFGCIMAELLIGMPLLYGLLGEQDQFAAIVEVFGHIPGAMVRDCCRRSSDAGNDVYQNHFRDIRGGRYEYAYLHNEDLGGRKPPGKKPLAWILGQYTRDVNFIDFVSKCLCVDPDRRLRPTEALRHPFLARV